MESGEAMKRDAGTALAAAAPTGTKIEIVDSEYGPVVADRKGEALYLFDKEGGPRSKCYGACAAVWPPLLTRGRPVAAAGARQGLLGTTRRRNGKLQVTYAGHPLYYYVDDSPGTILCHDVPEFGGTWLVVKPNGSAAA
jgi:predicted lipoprotein with Yx(FWY)xxD motif